MLFLYMQRVIDRDDAFNWFDSTAVPHYRAMFRMGTRHWMVVMFYERVLLLVVSHMTSFIVCCGRILGLGPRNAVLSHALRHLPAGLQLCENGYNSILGRFHCNGLFAPALFH